MKVKIGVVQFKIETGNPEKNLKRAEEFIKKASLLGANLVIFPENCIDKGELDLADKKGEYLKHFQALAKKYMLDVVPGSFLEKEGNYFYNTSYYLDSKGKIKAKYQKNHLWNQEKKTLTPGREIVTFKTQFGKMGLAVCWDLIFPEMFQKMTQKKVDIVLCPSYWCFSDAGKGIKYDSNSEIKLVDSLCTERAFENEIIIVYCNAAGEPKGLKNNSIGHSQITEPFKGPIKKLNHNKETMFIQEVDTAILKVAEQAYKIKADLKRFE